METWEPEEIFEKADFPVRKPGRKPPESGATPRQPAAGSHRTPNQQPGDRRARSPEVGVPPPPPAAGSAPVRSDGLWEPDLDFERADFSGIRPEEVVARGDDRKSSDTMANLTPRRPAPGPAGVTQARTWRPPRLSDQARADRKAARANSPGAVTPADSPQAPKVVGSRIRQGPGAPTGPISPAASAAITPAAPADPGFTERILQELVILNRENARHILRHWYWEKEGMAPEGLGPIKPHDRIHIVLRAMGPQVLLVLYESMSPTERRQMQEILDRPRSVSALEINRVRTVFMNLLRGEV